MSDGGRERRKSHESTDPHRKPGTRSFSRAIVRVGVSQICQNQGFQAFQQSALEALSDVAIRYMLDIGKTAIASANSAGRSEPNAFDIIHGVEDLHSVVGFSGAADIHRCLLCSGTLKEILNYVYDSDEIPFAYPLPSFPVSKHWRQSPSFIQSGEKPPFEHIPAWLPKFPNPEAIAEKEPMKVDKSLSNLHNGMACNGSKESNSGANPFLAAPICSDGKTSSPVILPPPNINLQSVNQVGGNHVEGKQALNDESKEVNPDLKKVLLKQRPGVQFKVKGGKKLVRLPLASIFREEDIDERDGSIMYDGSIDSVEDKKAQKCS